MSKPQIKKNKSPSSNTITDVEVLDSKDTKYYDKMGRGMKYIKIGRPSKLTYDLIQEISNALRDGCYVETAMSCNSVDKEKFYTWNKRAVSEIKAREVAISNNTKRKDVDEIYVQFHNAITKALADSERQDLMLISRAAMAGSWQAAAWRLERKHPERYGINSLREIGQEGVREPMKIEIVIDDQTDESRIKEMETGIINEINHR